MTKTHRPWYRLHWPTYVVALAIAAAVLACQWETSGKWFGDEGFGWPVYFPFRDAWRFSGFCSNLVLGLTLIVSSAAACEQMSRKPGPFWQVRLRSWFVLVAVTALLLTYEHNQTIALNRYSDAIAKLGPVGPCLVWPTILLPWHLRIPVLLALGCTYYELGYLVFRAVRGLARIMTRRNRRAHSATPIPDNAADRL